VDAAFWILAVGGLAALLLGTLFDGLLDLGNLVPDADWFSVPAIGGFCAVLGFTGILATSLGLPTAAALVIGLVAGALAFYAVLRLTRLLRRDDTEGATSREQLVGATAMVVSDVPADGYGEVAVVLAGTQSKFTARSEGAAIPRGTEVLVLSVLSDTAVLVREV
jgi:membrane protein implicated in regulation of membrane protease activity